MRKHIVSLFLVSLLFASGCGKKQKTLMEKAQTIIDDRIEARLGGFKAKDLEEYDDIAGDIIDLIDDLIDGPIKPAKKKG